ncbi:MAG: LytTR family transcriptional regulator, partial [Rhodobacteraceae bacterium]|nr:LytTR family transcriptional regulator [Paracoccaceae bacterium]
MGALSIGFTTPWLLYALLALPVLWLILRAIPPAPVIRRFPGVALLIGLADEDTVSDRTPWWLLLLRALAVAALILGLAGPVLNPEPTDTARKDRLLVLLDGGWASAANWRAQMAYLDARLDEAHRAGHEVALLQLSTPEPTRFQPAATLKSLLPGIAPTPWQPGSLENLTLPEADFDTLWLSDGLSHPDRRTLLTALEAKGRVSVVEPDRAA